MTLERDMDYLFNIAMLGLSSNWSATTSSSGGILPVRKYLGYVTYDEAITDKDFKDIRKYNRIARKYYALPKQSQRMLAALFDQTYQYPPQVVAMYNEYTGLSLFSNQVKTIDDLIKIFTTKNKILEKSIKSEIKTIYRKLEEQYDCSSA